MTNILTPEIAAKYAAEKVILEPLNGQKYHTLHDVLLWYANGGIGVCKDGTTIIGYRIYNNCIYKFNSIARTREWYGYPDVNIRGIEKLYSVPYFDVAFPNVPIK